MQAFTTLQGPAAALLQANVDTDVIIRIERLANVDRSELGRYALEALRYNADGSEDASFVLNQPAFRDAPILVTGPNFGCGSSREGAVWALQARGIRCIVGESFGEIFFANCFQAGVLAIRLPAAAVSAIVASTASGAAMAVDLSRQCLTLPDGSRVSFEVDAMRREALLHGLDDIGQTLKRSDAIAAWQAQDRQARPWVWA